MSALAVVENPVRGVSFFFDAVGADHHLAPVSANVALRCFLAGDTGVRVPLADQLHVEGVVDFHVGAEA